jgi:uracil-DNA glycosylase
MAKPNTRLELTWIGKENRPRLEPRGQWQTYHGIPFMPTFHPSYVLRVYTEDVRRKVWEDMQAVMEKLRQLG